jgi:hypothetical protein
MKINKEIIKKLNPCKERFDNFINNNPNFDSGLKEFLALTNITYSDKAWVFVRLATKEQNVKWSLACAESVLHIFENNYPEDNRPRLALKAAKNYLSNPDAAAYAAYTAAVDAAYTAYTAAVDAVDATADVTAAAYAAYTAAVDAAAYAAYTAAVDAAYTAAYATTEAAAYATADATAAAYAAYTAAVDAAYTAYTAAVDAVDAAYATADATAAAYAVDATAAYAAAKQQEEINLKFMLEVV